MLVLPQLISLYHSALPRQAAPAAKRKQVCRAMATSHRFANVFDLAAQWPLQSASTAEAAALQLLQISAQTATCRVPSHIAEKYGVQQDNAQLVVSITNKLTREQALYNEERARKPQTFKSSGSLPVIDGVAALDSTSGGKSCDFCRWQDHTAEDDFGRIETEHVVTASNLYKYCSPFHGLLLFKHHDPMHFSSHQLAELLLVGAQWFAAAAISVDVSNGSCNGDSTQGSSNDILVSTADGNQSETGGILDRGTAGSSRHWPLFLWNCLPRSGASQFHGHAQVALSKVPFPSDMLMMDIAETYEQCNGGQSYYEAIRRAHKLVGLHLEHGPVDDRSWLYASLTPRKDMEMVIHGPSLTSPSFAEALHAVLRTIVDDRQAPSFNVVIHPMWDAPARSQSQGQPFDRCQVVARVVGRGKLDSKASDFGALEVFADASIGHTDPYLLHTAVQTRLDAL